jgi:hypothetical protein
VLRIPDSGSGIYPDLGSGTNIPDHISESLEKFFRIKILKFFDANPGSGIFLTLDPGFGIEKFGSGIRNKHPG